MKIDGKCLIDLIRPCRNKVQIVRSFVRMPCHLQTYTIYIFRRLWLYSYKKYIALFLYSMFLSYFSRRFNTDCLDVKKQYCPHLEPSNEAVQS
jgi:hypothetical protein